MEAVQPGHHRDETGVVRWPDPVDVGLVEPPIRFACHRLHPLRPLPFAEADAVVGEGVEDGVVLGEARVLLVPGGGHGEIAHVPAILPFDHRHALHLGEGGVAGDHLRLVPPVHQIRGGEGADAGAVAGRVVGVLHHGDVEPEEAVLPHHPGVVDAVVEGEHLSGLGILPRHEPQIVVAFVVVAGERGDEEHLHRALVLQQERGVDRERADGFRIQAERPGPVHFAGHGNLNRSGWRWLPRHRSMGNTGGTGRRGRCLGWARRRRQAWGIGFLPPPGRNTGAAAGRRDRSPWNPPARSVPCGGPRPAPLPAPGDRSIRWAYS
ncbi:hypothetical protein MAIT1_04590 [Magnetofaba australis IT-1]|uniref:Uncharacterized protein n=1 Tax=Magnetofaba australis IT-1 TaxID=1434232 RepID=A0A1Y2K9Z4_9PROT|nr:hypothetical protein MAIT1_04590 [Magnetofaba australis IT-1]